jgi:hypothetical protein
MKTRAATTTVTTRANEMKIRAAIAIATNSLDLNEDSRRNDNRYDASERGTEMKTRAGDR